MDGGCVFGPVPKSQWEGYLKPDRRNRVRLSLNCLLIRLGDQNILVDTGAGSKRLDQLRDTFGLSGNKLTRSLKAHDVAPRQIDKVVLSKPAVRPGWWLHQAGPHGKVDSHLPQGHIHRTESGPRGRPNPGRALSPPIQRR